MLCTACALNPEAHCFVKFGKIGDVFLYYTAPARARDYKESESQLANMKAHLETTKPHQWIMIVDCKGMQLKHMNSVTFSTNLATILVNEYKHTLRAIWVLHANSWVNSILNLFNSIFSRDTMSKIHLINGDKLELYVRLERNGLSGRPLQWLTTVLTTPAEPGHLPALN